jgi:hypothetical protein
LNVEVLRRPLYINARNGAVYALRVESLAQTGLFPKVGRIDDMLVKIPSTRGFEDIEYVTQAQTICTDIRSLEEAERF